MKSICSIFLATTLLLLSVRDMVTIAAFTLRQETIAATLCVNKSEPIPMCAGQCFLDQQLEENHQDADQPLSAPQTELSDKTVYIPSFSITLVSPNLSGTQIVNFAYQDLLPCFSTGDTFRPPRLFA
jgi:hypothetical protein